MFKPVGFKFTALYHFELHIQMRENSDRRAMYKTQRPPPPQQQQQLTVRSKQNPLYGKTNATKFCAHSPSISTRIFSNKYCYVQTNNILFRMKTKSAHSNGVFSLSIWSFASSSFSFLRYFVFSFAFFTISIYLFVFVVFFFSLKNLAVFLFFFVLE